jgi:enoyl-[acyl-carrier protein] reductase I
MSVRPIDPYLGSGRSAVNQYNVVRSVKAAREASVGAMAAELAGPLKNRAAIGICHFDDLVQMAHEGAPPRRFGAYPGSRPRGSLPCRGASSGITCDTILS